jgi:hypothetical protein
MITFNGLKFAKNNSELVDSLFTSGGTCAGLYKRTMNGTKLYRPNGELFAYIVHNPKQGYFVVSAGMREDRPFYMYSTCSIDEKYLKLENVGPIATAALIKESLTH